MIFCIGLGVDTEEGRGMGQAGKPQAKLKPS